MDSVSTQRGREEERRAAILYCPLCAIMLAERVSRRATLAPCVAFRVFIIPTTFPIISVPHSCMYVVRLAPSCDRLRPVLGYTLIFQSIMCRHRNHHRIYIHIDTYLFTGNPTSLPFNTAEQTQRWVGYRYTPRPITTSTFLTHTRSIRS